MGHKKGITSQFLFERVKRDFQADQMALNATPTQIREECKAISDWLDEIKRSAKHTQNRLEAQQLEADLHDVREYRSEVSRLLKPVQHELDAVSLRRKTLWNLAVQFQELEKRKRLRLRQPHMSATKDNQLHKELIEQLLDGGYIVRSELGFMDLEAPLPPSISSPTAKDAIAKSVPAAKVGTITTPARPAVIPQDTDSKNPQQESTILMTCFECGQNFHKKKHTFAIYCSSCESELAARRVRFLGALNRASKQVSIRSAWPGFVVGRGYQGGAPG